MRLKDVTEFCPAYTGATRSDAVAFVPMEALRYDCITQQEIPFAEARGKYTFFADGDLLFAKVTPCFENGNIAVATGLKGGIGFGSSEIFVLRAKPGLNNRYLFYVVQASPFLDGGCATMCGVGGLKRMSPLFPRTFEWEIPSEKAQKEIVAYLDEKAAAIDARVAVLEKKLAAYRRLKASVINRAVTRGVPGWGAGLGLGERDDRDHRDERDESHETLATHCRAVRGAKAPKRRVPDVPEVSEVPCRGRPVNRTLRDSGVDWIGKIPEGWGVAHLKRLTKKIGSGKTPAGGAEVYGAEGVMFLRSQNVYNDGLMLNDVAFITPLIDLEMSSTRVFAGDVLLNITGGSIGRCCVYTRQEHANVNQHVCIIRADTKRAHNAFIKYFWNSLGQVYLRLSQLGGNRESLNFEQIGNVLFPVPPLPEQRAIADYLDAECAKIDKMAELVTREIELYRKLKRSLINEVMTGKRKVA